MSEKIQGKPMGIILCSKHGQSGIAFVCHHVLNAVITNQPIAGVHLWRCHVASVPIQYHFCPTCINDLRSHGLPQSEVKFSTEQEIDPIEALIATARGPSDVVCGRCLNDAIGFSYLPKYDKSP